MFRALRDELGVTIDHQPVQLAPVPTDDEIRCFYDAVWNTHKTADAVLVQTLLYTGVRAAELVAIRLDDVDLDNCRIHITNRTRGDRDVPFPPTFRDTLSSHTDQMRTRGASHLFESSWKKPYSTRGVRALFARYAHRAGLDQTMAPQRIRRYLFAWLKTRGLDDALIQPYSGHQNRSPLARHTPTATLDDAQPTYDTTIVDYPIQPNRPHTHRDRPPTRPPTAVRPGG